MDLDDKKLNMHFIQQQILEDYVPLLHLLQNRQFTSFKSLMLQILSKDLHNINVNHHMPHPILMSFLDKAVSDNMPEFIQFLLNVGADPNIVNLDRNRAPIHFAAECGNNAALDVLLKNQNIKLNLEAGGLTAMHYAIKADSKECTRLLLEAGASPNLPNSRGLTALHFAAEKNNRAIVQLIIDISQMLDLDTYRDHKGNTARIIIERKFPDMALPETAKINDFESLLHYYLMANDEENFLKVFQKIEDFRILANKAELLKIAVQHNLRDATMELLYKDILDSEDLFELGKIAVEHAYPDILRELLSKNSKLANQLLLPVSQELGISTRFGPNNKNNRFECLKIILNQERVNVCQEDDKGNSPLHYAARAECQEAIEMLLHKGCYIGHINSFGALPLVHISSEILKKHLDECLTSCNECTEEYEIIMDYRNLIPHSTHDISNQDYENNFELCLNSFINSCNETEALLFIANKKNLRHLLKHPLLASFLYLKFLRIRHVLYINFTLYLIFFILLNLYIWLITTSSTEHEVSSVKSTSLNNEEIFSIARNWKNQPIVSTLLFISVIYILIRESLQFISSPLHYIGSPENWLEIILIGLTLSLLCGAGTEIGAMAVLLSTWELVILMAQHPRMSTDIEMFKTVTINFTRFLFLYIFLILAFAFSFYLLFKENENFPNPFASLFKTIIMITGEFDSGDLPFISYPVLSRLIFIGFIFLIVIILLNLLNGLAVNDTAEILAEAELVCLISRVRLVAYVERIVLGSFFSSRNNLYCCINYFSFQNFIKTPACFIINKILLFPSYLPHAKVSVKPLKRFEITLHGRVKSRNRCSTLNLDPIIGQRAKEILVAKNRQSNEDKILIQLGALKKSLEDLKIALQEIRVSLANNKDVSEKTINQSKEYYNDGKMLE